MPRLPLSRNDQGGDALDRAPLLAQLEPELRKQVRKRLSRRRISAGKTLFRQGDPADALYLIESGRLRTFVSERPGRERVLQFLGPGEIIGEAAFIAETPHVTTAAALEEASVWRLARQDFDALLGKHDALLRYLVGVIAERQTRANARLAVESAPEEARGLRGFVTAVFSPRGGAGVTTIALNLGITLAQRMPDDVVLLDLDVAFGHALANLWLEPRGVLAQASPVTLRGLDRGGLEHYLLAHSSSLRVFPSATKPEEGQTLTGEHVRSAVETLRRHFGQVVLDMQHSFADVPLTALELADRVIVVATPEKTTLRDLRETQRIFTEVLMFPEDKLYYVLNHPQPYASLKLNDFAATTTRPWLEIGHGGDAPTAAALRGESLMDTRRNSPMTRGVTALADHITRDAREAATLAGRA